MEFKGNYYWKGDGWVLSSLIFIVVMDDIGDKNSKVEMVKECLRSSRKILEENLLRCRNEFKIWTENQRY